MRTAPTRVKYGSRNPGGVSSLSSTSSYSSNVTCATMGFAFPRRILRREVWAMVRLTLSARWFAPVIASCLLGGSVEAQGRAALTGIVRDRSSGSGIANAHITSALDGRSVLSDSSGKYLFLELAEGPSNFLVRAVGFAPESLAVTLTAGRVTERAIQLDS